MWQFPLLSCMQLSIATQAFPSPVQPTLHWQVALPGPVLVHRACRRRERKALHSAEERKECCANAETNLFHQTEESFWMISSDCSTGDGGWNHLIQKWPRGYHHSDPGNIPCFQKGGHLCLRWLRAPGAFPAIPWGSSITEKIFPAEEKHSFLHGHGGNNGFSSLSAKIYCVPSAILFPSMHSSYWGIEITMRSDHLVVVSIVQNHSSLLRMIREFWRLLEIQVGTHSQATDWTHIKRAQGERECKTKTGAAYLCGCQNMWATSQLLPGPFHLAINQMTDLLTVTVLR